MAWDIDTVAKLIAPVLTLIIGAVIKQAIEGRPKLVSYYGHVSTMDLPGEPPQQVFTHSVIIRNTGRKPAKNVRLGHHVWPPSITLSPSVQYSIETNPEGKSEIVIPTLVSKEQVTVSYLYFPPVTAGQINTYVKSDEGYSKAITVMPIPAPSKFTIALVGSLMFVGASFITYWLIRLIYSSV
jgi:hypothetical protein